jgi:LPS-assembly lipoprotein
MKAGLRGLSLCLLVALLAACGFHAAGTRPLPEPLKRVRVDLVAPYRVSEPPVETSLRDRLVQRGAEVVKKDKGDDGVTVIRLSDLREAREVLSVGPDGKALEYELILRVRYEVRTGQHVWIPPSQMEARHDYSFNAQQVLPKEQEAERLREFLENELAEMLMLRIEATTARAAEEPEAAVPATAPDAAPAATGPDPAPMTPAPVPTTPPSTTATPTLPPGE